MMIRHETGFSLIELMAVIVILAVMIAVGVKTSDFIQTGRLNSATRELFADLERIRTDAMTRQTVPNSRGFGIRFTSGSGYTLFEFSDDPDNDGADATDNNFVLDGGAEEVILETKTLPSSVTVAIQPDPSETVLIYDKRGMTRDPDDWSAGSDRVFVLSHPGVAQSKCVNVTRVMIREGIWNGANCVEN